MEGSVCDRPGAASVGALSPPSRPGSVAYAPGLGGSVATALDTCLSSDQRRQLYRHGRWRRKEFRDVGVLGAGGEATVLLCVSPWGALVALKCSPKSRSGNYYSSADPSDAFEREMRARFVAVRAHAGHPHLIRYIECFETKSRFYNVMEHCPGGTLATYTAARNGKLSECEAQSACRVLMATVAYLHLHGIVHRDIKPQNVLLRREGDLGSMVLADFDSSHVSEDRARALLGAKDLEGSVNSGEGLEHSTVPKIAELPRNTSQDYTMRTIRGTPFYLAPEVARGLPYNSAVDVWAIGCIAYELLLGEPPFASAASIAELFSRITAVQLPPPVPGVTNLAADFVQQLLRPEPGDRPTAAEARRHLWLRLGAHGRKRSGVEVFLREESGELEVLPTD